MSKVASYPVLSNCIHRSNINVDSTNALSTMNESSIPATESKSSAVTASLNGTDPPATANNSVNTDPVEIPAKPLSAKPLEKLGRSISKTSIISRKRNGSITSSRRSVNARKSNIEKLPDDRAANTTPAAPSSDGRKAGGPRFLSFLGCCGGSDTTNNTDVDEQSVPVRALNKGQSTQTTLVKKRDLVESSTANSKDASVEKIGGPPYSDLKSAGEPKMLEPPVASASTTGAPTLEDPVTAPLAVPVAADQSQNDIQECEPNSEAPERLGESSSNPTLKLHEVIQIPENEEKSGAYHESHIPSFEGENTTDDRSASQGQQNPDTSMSDAPSLPPTVSESTKSEQEPNDPSALPPPPPLTQKRQTSSVQRDRSLASQTSAAAEHQKWLLPPIRPEFHGKKCLVLDLDETLVHSSFKVFSFRK